MAAGRFLTNKDYGDQAGVKIDELSSLPPIVEPAHLTNPLIFFRL
jgi:hypothetical protein